MPPRRKRQKGGPAPPAEAAQAPEPSEAALWMGWCQEDLEQLHQEVEAGAHEVGVELDAFLDATSFWETPRRAKPLALRLGSLAQELGAEIGRVRSATEAELRCGSATAARYLRQLRKAVQQASRAPGGWKWLDTDKTSAVTASSERAARRSVGITLEAISWVMQSKTQPRRAMVINRPPGHHNGCNELLEAIQKNAWRFAAHGGCILNETAIAVRNLLARHPQSKVVILDLDAHFGDGTAWQFYEDQRVLCISIHVDQSDLHFFPFLKGKAEERGYGAGKGATMNLPLPEGAGDAEAWKILSACAWPEIEAFGPDVLCIAMGFDGLEGDPSAPLRYSAGLFEACAARARQCCRRVVCTLQGGYLPEATADAFAVALRALAGAEPAEVSMEPLLEDFDEYCLEIQGKLRDESLWWSVEQSFDYIPEGFRMRSPSSSCSDADMANHAE